MLFSITLPFKSVSCLWISKNPALPNPLKGHFLALQTGEGDTFCNLSFLSCFPEQCSFPFPEFNFVKITLP